ncbi:MAG: PhzF family phenazine biosynthesis protein [Cyanobium sp.]
MTAAVLIEAFSAAACAGNGAAVVRLEQAWPEERLQALAGSLRQSETAFLLPVDGHWLLRWFTPVCEVPLCGHATLAAVLALGHWRALRPGEGVRFHTRSGPLAAQLEAAATAAAAAAGSIDLPGGSLQPAATPAALERRLQDRGLGPVLQFWTSALGYAVALLPDRAPLAQQRGLAEEIPPDLSRGLVLMQAATAGSHEHGAAGPAQLAGRAVDYRLRFFAPGLGIPEDPVTGSAHALISAWWQQRLGRTTVVGWQCSDRPGGVVSQGLSSGMIRLFGSGHLLWDGTLHLESPDPDNPGAAAGPCSAAPAAPWPDSAANLSSGPSSAPPPLASALPNGWRDLLPAG